MEPGSEIFPIEVDPLVSKYSKRILTARIIMITLAILCFFVSAFSLFAVLYLKVDDYTNVRIYTFGGFGVLYLILFLRSKGNPYSPILIAAIINAFELIFGIIGKLSPINRGSSDVGFFLLIQLLVTFYLFRGLFFARKKVKLLEQR